MATVVKKSNTGSPPCGNGQIIIKFSANTPDYDPIDWFINPDLSNVIDHPIKYWQHISGSFSLCTEEEIIQVDETIEAVVQEVQETINTAAGIGNISFNATSYSSSTTTSYYGATKINAIFEDVPVGDYFVSFTMRGKTNSDWKKYEMSFYHESSELLKTRYAANYSYTQDVLAGTYPINVSTKGTVTFKLKYKVVDACSVTVDQASINFWKG